LAVKLIWAKSLILLSAAFSTEQFKLVQVDEFRFTQTQILRSKYLDKPQISFTDLTSIFIMEELNIYRILTEDDHFNQVGLGFQLEPALP
jgi:uncharacterized protein